MLTGLADVTTRFSGICHYRAKCVFQGTGHVVPATEGSLVEIYGYFKNERKTSCEIGWNETTVYDFDEDKPLFLQKMVQAGPKDTPP